MSQKTFAVLEIDMFCPGCGQQQVSEEIRFCSRCGLPLGLVTEILANNGFLPQLEELSKRKGKLLTRRNGLIFSLYWFIFFVFIFTPFWAIVNVDELAAISAIIGIFGSLLCVLTSMLFLEKVSRKSNNQMLDSMIAEKQSLQGFTGKANALPPQQSVPASAYVPPNQGNWRDTNDLAQPSVTEETTRLLEKESK